MNLDSVNVYTVPPGGEPLRFMVDLETLGTNPGCQIVSIGAVQFNAAQGVIPGTDFYTEIDLRSQVAAGLTEDPDTRKWWENQSEEVREALTVAETGVAVPTLAAALHNFQLYLPHVTYKGAVEVWSNGADFDIPVLIAAYRAAGFGAAPWRYRGHSCYRTLRRLRPRIPQPKIEGARHNALADARVQAAHAALILKDLGA